MKIEHITQMAKDTILEHGEHMPMVYVEFKECKEINLLALPDIFSSEEGKSQRFFGVGRKLGMSYPDREIAQLAFVVEMWMAHQEIDKPLSELRPSEDPNRVEALVVNTLDIVPEPDSDQSTIEEGIHVIEMLRDGAGNLVDLLHKRNDDHRNVHSTLLTSLLSGFCSTKLSKEKIKETAMKMLTDKGLSEEEAQKLLPALMKDVFHSHNEMYMLDVSSPENVLSALDKISGRREQRKQILRNVGKKKKRRKQ